MQRLLTITMAATVAASAAAQAISSDDFAQEQEIVPVATTEALTTETPTTETPTTETPTTETPTTETPTAEANTAEANTAEANATEAPTTETLIAKSLISATQTSAAPRTTISTFLSASPSASHNPRKPHLDVSFTAGTMGLGFDLSMPINSYIGIRSGAAFMPHFSYPLTFTAQLGDGDQMTADGTETRFERMAGLLEGFVGQEVDDKVDMLASPHVNQFKFMVDVTPFRRKGWHFTAGFYLGKSNVARCINKNHEIATLFAVNLYNRLYENNGEIALGFSLPPDILMQILNFGQAGFPLGQYVNDVVYPEDVWIHDDYLDIDYIEHAKGDVIHAKGDTYLLAPSSDNTVYVDAHVSKFRPYFGFGYSGAISRDRRWSLGFDAGVMMWGGAPKLVDHSGVDLMYDLQNIGGQVGQYVDLARHMKAYPMLEFKITHRLFL